MIQNDFMLEIEALAKIPEHSPGLMRAMSGGAPFRIGSYLFFAADDWLTAIGYPLQGSFNEAEFDEILKEAVQKSGAVNCFAIAPIIPKRLKGKIIDSDQFYVLGADAKPDQRLKNSVEKARQRLRVNEGSEFTASHRRLWGEFLQRHGSGGAMKDRVAELYLRAPKALGSPDSQLKLLDAVDENGAIAASLLLDYEPKNFVSYIIGAHSRKHYIPHATDLLFAEMLTRAQKAGKRFVHLGLGVNDGIRRFKIKWGAVPSWPYQLAQWTEGGQAESGSEASSPIALSLARALLATPGISARRYMENQPVSKPYAMCWELEKNGRISWIGGTAHFFCFSFEPSFRKMFRNVDNVIFEGPLDAGFMEAAEKAGAALAPGARPLLEMLTEREIMELEKTIYGPQGRLAQFLGMAAPKKTDVRRLLAGSRPWHAFFSLWTAFLERLGWRESVDMEAWRIASDMGKNVIAMENLEEQLESLGSLPVDRVLRFFRNCRNWKGQAGRNRRAYLAGDLEKMMGSSAEFPTRTEHVVGRRDQRFRERMLPWLEQGRAAVFVGTAHMVNLRHMLAEDGFIVRQKPFGFWPRLHLNMRRRLRPDEKVKW